MTRIDVGDLKNLNSVENLADIFSAHRLNYQYEASLISTRQWKDEVANLVCGNDIKLLAKHDDFHIIYCRIESLRLGTERSVVNQLLKGHPYLLAIFSDQSSKNWHFVNVKYDEEIKNRRLFRRIVIGPDERLHTAAERINKLEITDEKIGAIEVQNKHDEAFDVEEVTKEFFDKFTDIFHILCEDIEEENPACKGDCDAQAQLILNRLMFLYFIQKKGWLNNNTKYLHENFLTYWEKDPKGDSFYSKFLVQLFQALSSQKPLFKDLLGKIPFLNGGLFEIDPFTTKLPFKLHIKNSTFKKIFEDLLEKFNFTVREDTPLDVEVAIDPEILGKVFENLILKLEKGEDLRKKTGSYYTPRVIVHFMCQESLKEYLIGESEIERNKIESLFKMNPAEQLTEEEVKFLGNLLTEPQTKLLKNLIQKAYILDPAVGSGAFLVGMLHEMISIIKLLDVRKFGKEHIQKANYDYELKRQLIESCLYGVDIQEQAVRICELRLWLSLIVDYEEVRGEIIPPLPNLSYKIKRGDSLIDHLFGQQIKIDMLFKDESVKLIDEIQKKKHNYFKEIDLDKKIMIEAKIMSLQCELAETELKVTKESRGQQLMLFEMTAEEQEQQEHTKGQRSEINKLLALVSNIRKKLDFILKNNGIEKIDILKLYPSEKISFVYSLDFAEVFKEKKGFDIIIANPPYVRQEKIIQIKPILQKYFHCYTGTADLYVYFYEESYKLLKKSGTFCFISSNKFMRTGYGEKLRDFLSTKTVLKRIVDFNGLKIFEATVDTCIILFQKSYNAKNKVNIISTSEDLSSADQVINYIKARSKHIDQINIDKKEWSLQDEKILNLKKKIEGQSIPLKEYCGEPKSGIKTGLNEVLILDKDTKSKIINKNKWEEELYVPIIKGQNIKKWHYEFEGFYLIFADGKDIDKYPNTKKYLMEYKKELTNRSDIKDTKKQWFELRPCAYYGSYKTEKIIFPDISDKANYTFDDKKCFFNNTAYMIPKGSKYLLALLNSKLLEFYFTLICSQLGEKGMRFIPQFVNKIPIKETTHEFKTRIINLVDKILVVTEDKDYLADVTKQSKVKEYENEIDQLVYEIYGLNNEEIKLVENSFKEKE